MVITATTANGQDWNSGIATDALTGLTIAVNDGAAQDGGLDTGIVNVTVENNGGATLPETGRHGHHFVLHHRRPACGGRRASCWWFASA